jgi:adenosyl cobinamide kinase/adenosyl cobinamide phosphate guanylyltransferase
MASKITKKTDIQPPLNVVGLIYGVSGIGKTTLALSAPKPLLLDTDGGIHRVQCEYRSDVVQVQSYQDILDVLQEDLSDYETIVIDTMGELVQFMLRYFSEKDKSLITKKGTYNVSIWGMVKQEFARLKQDMQLLHKNLIFVAHESVEKDGETRKICMDVQGSTDKDVTRILDFMGFCEMVGETRSISFQPSENFNAKNSLELPKYLEIPTLHKGDINDFLDRVIIQPTYEQRKNENKKFKEAEKELDKYLKLVEKETDPNALMEKIKVSALNTYGKKVVFKAMCAKWEYDKEKGAFNA